MAPWWGQKEVQQVLNFLHFGDQNEALGAPEEQSQQLLKAGSGRTAAAESGFRT
jgi:hypothetical protein